MTHPSLAPLRRLPEDAVVQRRITLLQIAMLTFFVVGMSASEVADRGLSGIGAGVLVGVLAVLGVVADRLLARRTPG